MEEVSLENVQLYIQSDILTCYMYMHIIIVYAFIYTTILLQHWMTRIISRICSEIKV